MPKVMVRKIQTILTALGLIGNTAFGQPVTEAGILERMAARAAMQSVGAKDAPRTILDPMLVMLDEAPGHTDMKSRDNGRNAALAGALRARVARRQDVIDCQAGQCRLRDADVVLVLSEPQASDNNARVTVTVLRNSTRRVYYVTMNIHLHRLNGAWKVLRIEQLGIS
jgi:hypothetical protein